MYLELQNKILEMIARRFPMAEIAREICVRAEQYAPSSRCSILQVDADGRLRGLGAPSLPAAYCAALEGLAIGPSVGSCGAAAYLGRPITVVDIATHPLWDDYRSLATAFGLAACWSTPIFGSDGRVIGTFAFYFPTARGPNEAEGRVVATCVDLCSIAIERHEAETAIHRLAYFDGLTGLGNRANFDRELSKEYLPDQFGLLMIDVDGLKVFNDTLGHAAGDDVLREIGSRIGATAPAECAFRVSGDEFAVILLGPKVGDMLQFVADALLEVMRHSATCGGRAVQLAITIGGAVYGPDGETIDSIRRKADIALYHAKALHRGGFERYSEGLSMAMARTFQAIREVQDAIEDDRVEAFFQPVVRLDTGEIVGVEALCRVMDHDEMRMPEAQFQLAMSDATTAARLTENMMIQVARALRSWLNAGIPFQHVGINVGAGDFQTGELERRMSEIFDRFGVPLRHVILEVTEMIYLGKSDLGIAEAVKTLRSQGLLVALDDFGTGYASLTHLLTFPVDIIKIDKSFVADLDTDGPGSVIIGSLIDIARKLGMRVVAEGVETERQAQLLRDLGCVLGQGYYYAKPANYADTTNLLIEKAQRPTGEQKQSIAF